MPKVTAPNKEQAEARLDAAIALQVAIAFEAHCRLAARVTASGDAGAEYVYWYDFIVLSPGEFPPEKQGWTLYEDRGGIAVGRTA